MVFRNGEKPDEEPVVARTIVNGDMITPRLTSEHPDMRNEGNGEPTPRLPLPPVGSAKPTPTELRTEPYTIAELDEDPQVEWHTVVNKLPRYNRVQRILRHIRYKIF